MKYNFKYYQNRMYKKYLHQDWLGILNINLNNNHRSFIMDYGDHQCVGCDAHTFGIYRANPNWHLCWSCYEMWQDNQEELQEETIDE